MAQSTDHKESTASVRIVYRKYDTLKDGSHPFFVCITKARQRKYIATGLSLHPKYWNEKKGTFRKNVPPAERKALKASFRAWEEKYTNAAQTLAGADEVHDAKAVATKVSSERLTARKFRLLEYFDELIAQFEKTGNVGNRKVYRDVQNNLSRYIGAEAQYKPVSVPEQAKRTWSKDVPFDAVTVRFCNEWENKMRSEGLTEITLSVKFRTLRAVLNKAIANSYAKATSYPFARNTAETHKFQVGKFDTKTTKRAISKADIRDIEKFQPELYTGPYASLRDTTVRQLLAKDIFLFSYYCGGINFVDIAMLTWSNIATDLHGYQRLNYTRQKTGGKLSIRLMPVAHAILERYCLNTSLQPLMYIFPILNNTLHKTPSQKHNRCSKIMGQVNTDLKIIGKAVGLNTPLTTYVARHSFATSLRLAGQDISVISQAMGHSDEATTRIYLQDLGTELIDAAYEVL